MSHKPFHWEYHAPFEVSCRKCIGAGKQLVQYQDPCPRCANSRRVPIPDTEVFPRLRRTISGWKDRK